MLGLWHGRSLYWTESQLDGDYRLMKSHLDGSDVRTVVGRRRTTSRKSRSALTMSSSSPCSCPAFFVVPSFAIDFSQSASPLSIYAADSQTGDVWALDETACQCRLIVNATALSLTSSDTGLYTLLCHNSAVRCSAATLPSVICICTYIAPHSGSSIVVDTKANAFS